MANLHAYHRFSQETMSLRIRAFRIRFVEPRSVANMDGGPRQRAHIAAKHKATVLLFLRIKGAFRMARKVRPTWLKMGRGGCRGG